MFELVKAASARADDDEGVFSIVALLAVKRETLSLVEERSDRAVGSVRYLQSSLASLNEVASGPPPLLKPEVV